MVWNWRGMPKWQRTGWRHAAAVLALAQLLAGCALTDRVTAVPASGTRQATIPGIPNARYYGGDTAALMAEFERRHEREAADARSEHRVLSSTNYLAISGGGDNGAFGAGLLVGWSEQGTRPSFQVVSGVTRSPSVTGSGSISPTSTTISSSRMRASSIMPT
jgi:hypothetical protein